MRNAARGIRQSNYNFRSSADRSWYYSRRNHARVIHRFMYIRMYYVTIFSFFFFWVLKRRYTHTEAYLLYTLKTQFETTRESSWRKLNWVLFFQRQLKCSPQSVNLSTTGCTQIRLSNYQTCPRLLVHINSCVRVLYRVLAACRCSSTQQGTTTGTRRESERRGTNLIFSYLTSKLAFMQFFTRVIDLCF